MLNQGVTSSDDPHTTADGIWKKLGTMYDLSKLNEREDSVINDITHENGGVIHYWREFELPKDEYEELMWERRLNPNGSQSPEWSRRESTVADTDEPRSSPVSGRGSVRGTRAPARKGGRLSKLQSELATDKGSRRSSKAASVVDDDTAMADAEDEEEVGEEVSESDEDSEQDEQDEEEKKTKARKAGRGGRRVRGRRGRRG